MKKIFIKGYIWYDDKLMHGDDDIDAKVWFMDSLLRKGELIVHSNNLGGEVGELVIEEMREDLP